MPKVFIPCFNNSLVMIQFLWYNSWTFIRAKYHDPTTDIQTDPQLGGAVISYLDSWTWIAISYNTSSSVSYNRYVSLSGTDPLLVVYMCILWIEVKGFSCNITERWTTRPPKRDYLIEVWLLTVQNSQSDQQLYWSILNYEWCMVICQSLLPMYESEYCSMNSRLDVCSSYL